MKPVQQIQSENDVCVCDVKFDEVMRDGLSLYSSKLTWGTQTLHRSSKNMVEYKDTNETIKRIKHANQKKIGKNKYFQSRTKTVLRSLQYTYNRKSKDLLHIHNFII